MASYEANRVGLFFMHNALGNLAATLRLGLRMPKYPLCVPPPSRGRRRASSTREDARTHPPLGDGAVCVQVDGHGCAHSSESLDG